MRALAHFTSLESGLPHMFDPHSGQVNFTLLGDVFFSPARCALCRFSFHPVAASLAKAVANAIGDDVVHHVLTGFLAADHAVVGRLQPDRLHLRGPFLVVIAARAWLAVHVLPEVNHLVHERLAGLLVLGLVDEGIRIERQLVLPTGLPVTEREPVRREIAERVCWYVIKTSDSIPSNSAALK